MQNQRVKFLINKYYPVDVHNQAIYLDAFNTVRECLNNTRYKVGFAVIKGSALNAIKAYQEFQVLTLINKEVV